MTDYTVIEGLRGNADLTLQQLESILLQRYGARVSYSYLHKLEKGHRRTIVNFRKRQAVEQWIADCQKRPGKKK